MGHSRGAVASGMISNNLSVFYKNSIKNHKIDIALVMFDPVPGPSMNRNVGDNDKL